MPLLAGLLHGSSGPAPTVPPTASTVREKVPIVRLLVAYFGAFGDASPRAAGRLPRGYVAGTPFLRITRIGGTADFPGHVDHPRVQIDAYGDTDEHAEDVALLALKRILDLPGSGWRYPGAIVTDAREELGILRSPDPDGDASPRYLFGVILTDHPTAV